MEQNLPLVAKRVWNLVRLMLFILRKNICKKKLLLDVNMMMKRGKVAGKALQNLMFHHHHNWASFAFNRRSHDSQNFTFRPPHIEEDYEFSCSNSPAYPLSLFSSHKKHQYKKTSKKPTVEKGHDEIYIDVAVIKALEMLTSATASPMLPGFGNGKSPMVRQLRVTDSPFPLSNSEEDSYVDEAAEKFIMKFYNELRRQN
uniref:uncharacterized protein LOC122588355 n=1 Tax=Erigeron canadensis TaxID=72917 RepID=UPI001CB9AC1A|nr:uncharacterized protein LOC122588355 [Erigeron canadensis]